MAEDLPDVLRRWEAFESESPDAAARYLASRPDLAARLEEARARLTNTPQSIEVRSAPPVSPSSSKPQPVAEPAAKPKTHAAIKARSKRKCPRCKVPDQHFDLVDYGTWCTACETGVSGTVSIIGGLVLIAVVITVLVFVGSLGDGSGSGGSGGGSPALFSPEDCQAQAPQLLRDHPSVYANLQEAYEGCRGAGGLLEEIKRQR